MNNIKNSFNNHFLLFAFFVFLIVSLWFNGSFYWKIIFDNTGRRVDIGEIRQTEWGTERIYQKLVKGENPFSPFKQILVPFGLDVVMSDPGMGLFFAVLRPFFDSHKSTLISVVIGIVLANIGMFVLLKNFKIDKWIALIIGLSYGYMTFLLSRGGHANYSVSIFVFPWFTYFLIKTIESSKPINKILYTVLTSLLFVITLWLNVYYFIVLLISLFLVFIYMVLFKKKLLVEFIYSNFLYLLGSFVLIVFLLIPQLSILIETIKFSEPPNPLGWAGAIEFSSDILGFFIPSMYNYYYGTIVKSITNNIAFARNIFESFTYPGIIIISAYIYLAFNYRKISKATLGKIKPFIFSSIGFLLLTMGPFLHIAGNWKIPVENLNIVLPLPFVFLHYLPFFSNIRAPGRLIVGFIFLAYIVTAFLLHEILKNKPIMFKAAVLVAVFVIFVFDQRPMKAVKIQYEPEENKIYEVIGKDREKSSLLEIPFTVRDGLTYFGDYNSVTLTNHEPMHNKSIIGGYAGRIPDYVKKYYTKNALTGYLGRLIDGDINKNPSMINSNLLDWKKIDKEKSLKTVDFLDIKYITLDEKMPYAPIVKLLLHDLGFKKKLIVKNLSLWKKPLQKVEYFPSEIGITGDELLLGMGWYDREQGFRWSNKKNSVMLKILSVRNLSLEFVTESFYKPQKLEVFVNMKSIGKYEIDTVFKKYEAKIPSKYLGKGLNTVHFIFERSIKPVEIDAKYIDSRDLSAKFSRISITDLKK